GVRGHRPRSGRGGAGRWGRRGAAPSLPRHRDGGGERSVHRGLRFVVPDGTGRGERAGRSGGRAARRPAWSGPRGHRVRGRGGAAGGADFPVEAGRRAPLPILAVSERGGSRRSRLLAGSLFGAPAALHGDKAAWKLVDAHPDWTRSIAVDRPSPRDVNTWEEYQALFTGATVDS